ncbi:MAG: class I mannose-6-phosphate isomerase [Lachnospiraceae bacterium]|nr:class I mannose-6-phosphate isomerase [Lachnospiraceae bacterium]MBP5762768.1 class I mannose-6-phosphate isomerase [Lachnospiraceae bacterium]
MDKVILLNPYFSHTIWGGKKLREVFGYDEPGDDIGECWGISAHPVGESVAASGEFKGKRLSELWNEHRELFGNAEGDRFPLLVKIIDADDDLSIQVHPDDEYAKLHEDGALGKKECWYILDCPDDAELVIGHNARTADELKTMVSEGRWDDLIRKIRVRKGDVIQIDPGTVHSITAGVCLLETQQSSDITYRLYDYDRIRDGKKRELHLRKSFDVITVPAPDISGQIQKNAEQEDNSVAVLSSCDRYTVSKVKVSGEFSFNCDAGFVNATVIEGSGRVFDKEVKKGSHMLITAEGAKCIRMSGNMELIISYI